MTFYTIYFNSLKFLVNVVPAITLIISTIYTIKIYILVSKTTKSIKKH